MILKLIINSRREVADPIKYLVISNHDGVYNKWYLDALEGSFILNLGTLAAVT